MNKHSEASKGCGFYTLIMAVATLGGSLVLGFHEANLYHGSVSTMLKYIHMQKNSKNILFLVGHNPGMNDLIEHLGGKIDNLATSGQFGFLLDSEDWKDLLPKNVTPWFWDYPKKKG